MPLTKVTSINLNSSRRQAGTAVGGMHQVKKIDLSLTKMQKETILPSANTSRHVKQNSGKVFDFDLPKKGHDDTMVTSKGTTQSKKYLQTSGNLKKMNPMNSKITSH